MKTIILTQGKVAIVDNIYYEELNKHKWYAAKISHIYYARRQKSTSWGQTVVYMHREIFHLSKNLIIDHKNGNGLDNRLSNLRVCTQKQNCRNKKKKNIKNSTSKYKGVYWNKRQKKWHAQISLGHKRIHIGYFLNEKQAALKYNKYAIKYHGKFAKINEIASD